ncbi:MAG: hypothetical protein HQK63_06180 [Desulfamplus sp.]|nr:hypothetical protein [Desulfamplus sp.]
MKLRLFTSWAADKMEETLLVKDKKGYQPWEEQTHAQRYQHLMEEIAEAKVAMARCYLEEKRTQDAIKHLQSELVDVALTAMMLAGGFDENLSKLKRGRRM